MLWVVVRDVPVPRVVRDGRVPRVGQGVRLPYAGQGVGPSRVRRGVRPPTGTRPAAGVRPARAAGAAGAVRRGLVAGLAVALVAAVPAGGPVRADQEDRAGTAALAAVAAPAPLDPPAPDPGRIAYIGDGPHRSLVTAAVRGPLTPLLPVGRAGNDCQARARADDLVWVSDRDGTGEGLFRRTGDGPVTRVLARTGWRIADPVLSPDREWIAFVSWEGDGQDLTSASGRRCDEESIGAGTDAKPGVYVVRTDGTGLREAVPDADWADWSPDGAELVFTRAGRAWRTTVAAGGTPRPVTPAGVDASKPVWEPAAPDAPRSKDRIAYVTTVERDTGDGTVTDQVLATVPAAAGGAVAPVSLARGGYEDDHRQVAWAPDGSRLLFLSGEPYLVDPEPRPCGLCRGEPVFADDDVQLYETEGVSWYTAAGGAPQILLSGTDPEAFNIESSRSQAPLDRLQLRAAQGEESALSDPAYAPDGRRLAFVATTGPADLPATERILIGGDGQLAAAVPLQYTGMDPGEHHGRPAWSPDGTKLAFARWAAPDPDRPQPDGQIAVVDLAAGPGAGRLLYTVPGVVPPGGSGRCLTDDRDPAWSPDGARLAFSRYYTCLPGPIDPGLNGVARGSAPDPAPRTPAGVDTARHRASNAGEAEGAALVAAQDLRDRHIWTAPAAASGAQTDLSQKQCNGPNDPCRVVDLRPAYRPGGNEITYVRQTTTYVPPRISRVNSGYDGARMVLAVREDGSGCRSVIPAAATCPLRVGDWPTGLDFDRPDNPAWSPSGNRLAVDVRQDYGDGGHVNRLMVLNPAGTDTAILPGKIRNSQSQPTWQASADLRLYVTTDDSPLLLGATAQVGILLENWGIATSPGATVRVQLPPGLTPVDPLPAGCAADPAPGAEGVLTCTVGPLAAESNVEIPLALKGAALGDQPVTATATGTLPDHVPGDNEARLVITVVAADLAVTATAVPPVVRINQPSTVTFTVKNTGTAEAAGVLLKATLPPGLTVVTGTPCPDTGCPLGSLKPGESGTVVLGLTAPNAFTGTIEGTASTATVDPDSENDTAQVDLTVVDPRLPDPAVGVTATPARILTGEQSTVVWTVRNLGDAAAEGVVLVPLLPDGVTVVSESPACVPEPPVPPAPPGPPAPTGCVLGDLAPGAAVTLTRVVTAGAPLRGAVVGVVTAEADSNPTNNTAATPLTVDRQPPPPATRSADPNAAVTAGPRTAYTGGRVTAEAVVRNGGPVKATGLRLTVTVPAGMRLVSATRPGCLTAAGCPVPDMAPRGRFAVRLVLAAETALTGAVTATVTTTGTDRNPANNTASAAVTVRAPLLVLTPPLGPPGSVTQAHGSAFPPGATVRLRWSKGVTVASAPVVVRADGTFTAPVLVLVQDALGERKLTATHAVARAALFRPVPAPYLVVPGVLQPSDFQWRR
ncbi:hypothetical protein ACWCQL_22770 [Streptomyces sp. NPDC002073]